jgi:hypothetical protein
MIRLTRPLCPDERALRRDYRHPPNKSALRVACFDKCMYCESKVTQVYWGDVEHIKPKDVFPELEFDWDNLGFVCSRCNGEKSNKWSDGIPFIDPFTEDPDNHLAAVGPFIFHRNGSERGEYTWREIGLNRSELIERRNTRIKVIRDLYDKAIRTANALLRDLVLRELEAELADDKEYAMICRAVHTQIHPTPADEV